MSITSSSLDSPEFIHNPNPLLHLEDVPELAGSASPPPSTANNNNNNNNNHRTVLRLKNKSVSSSALKHGSSALKSASSVVGLTKEKPFSPRRNRKNITVPLFVVLCGFTTMTVIAAMCTLFFITQMYEHRAVQSVSARYTQQVGHHVVDYSNSYLYQAHYILGRYVSRLTMDKTSVFDWEFHRREIFNLNLDEMSTHVSNVYFISADGCVIFGDARQKLLVVHDTAKTSETEMFPNTSLSSSPCSIGFISTPFKRLREEMNFSKWKCETRMNYDAAVSSDTFKAARMDTPTNVSIRWTSLYRTFKKEGDGTSSVSTPNATGLTISRAVFIDGSFVGVVVADLLSVDAQNFMSLFKSIPKDTIMFIADADGNLFATRVNTLKAEVTNRLTAISTDDDVLAEVYEATRSWTPEQSSNYVNDVRVVSTSDGTYHVVKQHVGLPIWPAPPRDFLTVLIAVPQKPFEEELAEGTTVAVTTTVFMSVVAITLIVLFVYKATSPIRGVADLLEAAAELRLDQVPDVTKATMRIREVYDITWSSLTLVDQLREYRSYMPRSLVAMVSQAAEMDNEDGGELDELDVLDDDTFEENFRTSLVTQFSSRHRASSSTSTFSTPQLHPVVPFSASPPTTMTTPGVGEACASDFEATAADSRSSSGAPVISRRGTLAPIRVTISVFNIVGTNGRCRADDYPDLYFNAMTIAAEEVESRKGVPMFVFGDFLVVTYNAVKRCAAKEHSACAAALSTKRESNAAFTVGIATGTAMCGDLTATPDMRSFAVLGTAVNEAFLLQRLNARYGTNVLFSGGMYIEASLEFGVRVRDVVPFSRCTSTGGRLVVVELVRALERDPSKDEEWMYSVGASSDPVTQFNDAVVAMVKPLSSANNTTNNDAEFKVANSVLEKLRSTPVVLSSSSLGQQQDPSSGLCEVLADLVQRMQQGDLTDPIVEQQLH
eukprot:PhM_4_TR9566/c0_g1_i3/m.38109